MENTQKRILSAVVMIIGLGIVVYLGRAASLGLLGLVGVIVIDEVMVNMLKQRRFLWQYVLAQLFFVVGFIYFNFFEVSDIFITSFNNAGILYSFFLLFFLFAPKRLNGLFESYFKAASFLVGAFFLVPFMNLSAILQFEHAWRALLLILVLLNFGVDTGAWFFGKNFGKRKLWPSVSPKKTVEGLVGGVLTAVFISLIAWWAMFSTPNFLFILAFVFIAFCSQMGDLIQSKLKRLFGVKDSSQLIPGHGGVYDRVDSLVFIAPLFLFVIRNLR